MPAPKYKERPRKSAKRCKDTDQAQRDKDQTRQYIETLQDMLKDPENAKKAAQVLEQWLQSKQ